MKDGKKEARFRAACTQIVAQGGRCDGVLCDDCPGSLENHPSGRHCADNDWADDKGPEDCCANTKASAEAWLREHPEVKKKECTCSLRGRALGDGCEVCNPELARDMAYERIEELEAELKELKTKLRALAGDQE